MGFWSLPRTINNSLPGLIKWKSMRPNNSGLVGIFYCNTRTHQYLRSLERGGGPAFIEIEVSTTANIRV